MMKRGLPYNLGPVAYAQAERGDDWGTIAWICGYLTGIEAMEIARAYARAEQRPWPLDPAQRSAARRRNSFHCFSNKYVRKLMAAERPVSYTGARADGQKT